MKPFLRRLSKHSELPFRLRAFAVVVAGWITIMAVAQLFKYEEFPGIIDGIWEAGGSGAASVLAAAIVVCEVFSLPFLLNMRVTPLVRVVSLACGWFTAGVWFVIALWQAAASSTVLNQGYFGATVPITNDGVMLLLSSVLLAAVAAVTLWTHRLRKTA